MDEYFYIKENNSFDYKKPYAVICFDDGWADNYLFAFPVLKELSLPATIYLTSGLIGTRKLFWPEELSEILLNIKPTYFKRETKDKLINLLGQDIYTYIENTTKETDYLSKKQYINQIILHLKKHSIKNINSLKEILHQVFGTDVVHTAYERLLTWEEIKEMETCNISFGSHTDTHAILTNITIDEARIEIFQSKEKIEQELGHRIFDFSYPNGSHSEDIINLVKKAGFRSALSGINGISTFKTPAHLLVRKGINELRFINVNGELNEVASVLEWSDFVGYFRRMKKNNYH